MGAVDTSVRPTAAGESTDRERTQRPAAPTEGRPSKLNVNRVERVASTLLGAMLVARGIRKRSIGGTVAAVAGSELLYRGVTGHCHAYGALHMSSAGSALPHASTDTDPVILERSITIEKSRDELYRLWRDPATVTRVMEPIAEVTAVSETRAHWVLRGPMNSTVEWDAQLVEDRPGEMTRWESLAGSPVPIEGIARFKTAPQDWGTEFTLHFRIDSGGATGALAATAARIFSSVPKLVLTKVLHRFKSLADTGEIPTTKCQPAARYDGRDR